jgi:hypothetical protein
VVVHGPHCVIGWGVHGKDQLKLRHVPATSLVTLASPRPSGYQPCFRSETGLAGLPRLGVLVQVMAVWAVAGESLDPLRVVLRVLWCTGDHDRSVLGTRAVQVIAMSEALKRPAASDQLGDDAVDGLLRVMLGQRTPNRCGACDSRGSRRLLVDAETVVSGGARMSRRWEWAGRHVSDHLADPARGRTLRDDDQGQCRWTGCFRPGPCRRPSLPATQPTHGCQIHSQL